MEDLFGPLNDEFAILGATTKSCPVASAISLSWLSISGGTISQPNRGQDDPGADGKSLY